MFSRVNLADGIFPCVVLDPGLDRDQIEILVFFPSSKPAHAASERMIVASHLVEYFDARSFEARQGTDDAPGTDETEVLTRPNAPPEPAEAATNAPND